MCVSQDDRQGTPGCHGQRLQRLERSPATDHPSDFAFFQNTPGGSHRGNPGKSLYANQNSERLQLMTLIPKVPDELKTEGARAAWRAAWSLPQTKPEDESAVLQLCRLEDEAAGLRKEIEKQGSFLYKPVQNARGEVIGEEGYANPLTAHLRKIGAEAHGLLNGLGMTSYGRKRLGLEILAEADVPDELDELRERRRKRLIGDRAEYEKEQAKGEQPADNPHIARMPGAGFIEDDPGTANAELAARAEASARRSRNW